MHTHLGLEGIYCFSNIMKNVKIILIVYSMGAFVLLQTLRDRIKRQQQFLHLHKINVKTFTKSCPVNHVTPAANQTCEVDGARFLSPGHR